MSISVADLGEGPDSPLLWVKKKKKITEGRKASKTKPPPAPLPLAQGLDPPLVII